MTRYITASRAKLTKWANSLSHFIRGSVRRDGDGTACRMLHGGTACRTATYSTPCTRYNCTRTVVAAILIVHTERKEIRVSLLHLGIVCPSTNSRFRRPELPPTGTRASRLTCAMNTSDLYAPPTIGTRMCNNINLNFFFTINKVGLYCYLQNLHQMGFLTSLCWKPDLSIAMVFYRQVFIKPILYGFKTRWIVKWTPLLDSFSSGVFVVKTTDYLIN